MLKFWKEMSLPSKIFSGMILGFVIGSAIHAVVPLEKIHFILIVRLFDLCGNLFLNLFQMIVVPVVLISMIRGVTSMSNPAMLGKIGIKALLIFAVTTVIASTLGIIAAKTGSIGAGVEISFPKDTTVHLNGSIHSFSEILKSLIPKNMLKSVVDADMLQIIVISIICGLAISLVQKRVPTLIKLMEELDLINLKIVDLILMVAPYGVFCLLANTFSNFGIYALKPLAKYIICIIVVMFFVAFVVYSTILLAAKVSPLRFYQKFLPVMLLAFSTSSSNAVLPSNIDVVTNRIGVKEEISTFVLSLGATINMNGTAVMQAVAAIFIAQLYGIDLSLSQLVQIVAMCLVASVGTAGMPGAGIIMLGLVLQTIGLPVSGIALVLGVDRIVDMFRTSLNITGDAVAAVAISASENSLDRSKLTEPEKTNP